MWRRIKHWVPFWIFLAGCTSGGPPNLHRRTDHVILTNGIKFYDFTGFPTETHSPIEFLEFLSKNPKPGSIVSIKPGKTWVKEEHLKGIMSYVGSETKCQGISYGASAGIPENVSRIGVEAMVLIEGYLQKKHPPEACTLCPEGVIRPRLEDSRKYYEWFASKERNLTGG